MTQLTPKQRKLLKWVGYPLLGLVAFVWAVFYTFPYDRLKGKIIEVLSEKYDVSIASIEPTLLPGGIVLETVMLKTRPKKPEDKPVVVVLQKVELDLGLFAALRGHLDLDVLAEVAGGTLEGNVQYSKSGTVFDLETSSLPLANLPGVAEAVGLPMAGGLDAQIELELPEGKWKDAEGAVELSCAGCTVGDGKAKMKMKPNPKLRGRRARRAAIFAGDGLTVPRLNLGAAVAKIEIEDGVGTIESFEATSDDGFLKIEGEILFKDPVKTSTFPGCMTFKLSDELKKREVKFSGIEAMLPARSRQPDGSFAIPTKGTLAALRWDVKRRCKGLEGAGQRDRPTARNRSRPTITPGRGDDEDDEGPPPRRMPELPTPVDSRDDDGDRAARDDDRDEEMERELEGPGNSGPPVSGPRDDDVQASDDADESEHEDEELEGEELEGEELEGEELEGEELEGEDFEEGEGEVTDEELEGGEELTDEEFVE